VYESRAGLAEGDFNGVVDVYVQDVSHGGAGGAIDTVGDPVLVTYEGVCGSSTPCAVGGYEPDISGDGTTVVFTSANAWGYDGPCSRGTCLRPGPSPGPFALADANFDDDVFRSRLTAGPTTAPNRPLIVSRANYSTPGSPPDTPRILLEASFPSGQPSVNHNGTQVAFASDATNLGTRR